MAHQMREPVLRATTTTTAAATKGTVAWSGLATKAEGLMRSFATRAANDAAGMSPSACESRGESSRPLSTKSGMHRQAIMAIDALSELGRSVDLGRLTVQYRSMALLGDVILPRVHATENGSDIELVSQTGTAYAIVRMENR